MIEVLRDTPAETVYREVLPGLTRVWSDPKPGTEQYNLNSLISQALNQVGQAEAVAATQALWATQTPQAKDEAARRTTLMLAKVIRVLLTRLEAS